MEVLTLRELAGWMRVSPATIYGLIRKGKLKATKFGGQYRFRVNELDHLLKSVKPKGGSHE